MEGSDNNATSSPVGDAASRRRSGRVVRAPSKFSPDAPGASKRKRGNGLDDEDEENESPGLDGEESDVDDVIDDDEPGRRQKRKKPASQASRARKPAAKKPKINGTSHGAVLTSRPKKTARAVIDGQDRDDTYGDIFASEHSPEEAATRWYAKYQEDMAAAVTDLVNCILLAADCDQQVTEDDINDPDNCANRLTELQGSYEDQQISEYPLISRAKGTSHFRDLLVGFFKSLINILHETDVLYNDTPLMENIARWVASMSSSTQRPFRHTATTVALAMLLSLVEVAKKLDERVTKMTQQTETEKGRQGKRKDKASKDKLATMQRNLAEANQNREVCGRHMKEFFDTVFVHRYRDVDARIRTECVDALGSWIWVLPNVYMEPEYLRYLGWMLSDTVPSTRQEVLKQLARVFKRDAEKLGHFIDRFRPRLVEMATKDNDIGVRTTAISVIENLRSTGMMEPDEIDSIGKLIYDSEPRIRKAVASFFADCVTDLVESKREDVGGKEELKELFPGKPEGFDTLREDWINVKCLAETLAAYEAQLEDEPLHGAFQGLDISADILRAADPETRISLAAQVLFDKVPEVSNWEVLAGYLLHDHSVSTKSRSRSKSKSTETVFKDAVAPEGQEEPILLEVLASAVKSSLAQGQDSERNKKRPARGDGAEDQEEAALHLASIIPKLLRKYGAEPDTATVVLRLEHYLDLEVFQQLRQDSSTYARLLDEICTQFDRHADKSVISEATAALLHSRSYDDLQEMTDEKVAVLWENVINSLRNFDKTCELSARGNLDVVAATELSNVLLKISKLTSISNCIDVLESDGHSIDSSSPAIDILVKMVHRGRFVQPDEDLDTIEDELTANAISCCEIYFLWKFATIKKNAELQTDIPNATIDRLAVLKKAFHVNLIHTLSSRAYNDDLRLFSTGSLCDICSLFSGLTQFTEQPVTAAKYRSLRTLIQPIPEGLVNELISIFDSAERTYARKSKKTLNEPGEDEDPLDDDQLSDDEDDVDLSQQDRATAVVKAEKALCELTSKLVMAILAKMLDHTGPQAGKFKKRILRNQSKLGPTYKLAATYLDEAKLREAAAVKKKAAAKGKGKAPARVPVSEEIVVAQDDEEDPFAASPEPEEGTEEDLRRRELLDDPIEDPEEDDEEGQGNDGMDEDDDILGD